MLLHHINPFTVRDLFVGEKVAKEPPRSFSRGGRQRPSRRTEAVTGAKPPGLQAGVVQRPHQGLGGEARPRVKS